MVGDLRIARDPLVAAHSLLALLGIDEPTPPQRVGSRLVALFLLKVIAFLSDGKK